MLRTGTGVLALVAAGYTAIAWQIVFVQRIGPVVAEIDAGAGRGVHAGDVLAVPLVLLALATGAGAVALLALAQERTNGRQALAHRGHIAAVRARR